MSVKDMEIGEVRELENKKYKCVEAFGYENERCCDCNFYDDFGLSKHCFFLDLGNCDDFKRVDNTDVIFVEVEDEL